MTSRKIAEAEGYYKRSQDAHAAAKAEVKESEEKLRAARAKLKRAKLISEASLSLLEDIESEGD